MYGKKEMNLACKNNISKITRENSCCSEIKEKETYLAPDAANMSAHSFGSIEKRSMSYRKETELYVPKNSARNSEAKSPYVQSGGYVLFMNATTLGFGLSPFQSHHILCKSKYK